jgi:hypothetical protein
MEFQFDGAVVEWRGPAPFYFVAIPTDESADIKVVAKGIEYWGQVPVTVRIGDTDCRSASRDVTLLCVRRRLFPLVLIAGVMLVGSFAQAAPVSAAAEANVAVGYDGYILSGRSFPVSVEVVSDRLLRGRIEVRASSQGGPTEQVVSEIPIEVPGGGAKRFTVVVPSLTVFPGNPVSVSTRVFGDGSSAVATASTNARVADDRELVGVLPDLAGRGDLPGQVPLPMELGTAQLFELDPADLDLGPGVLEPLGSVAATSSDVADLAPRARRALLAWLEQGGTLLLDEPAGTPIAALPAEWQPASDGIGTAGFGIVELTGGALTQGRWGEVLLPTPSRVTQDPRFGGWHGESVGNTIARDAGLRIPQIGWMLGVLALYAVVVGPLMGIVLNRRRKAELAWIAIPLAAVIFTTGAYVAATDRRSNTRLAHASLISISPAGNTVTSFVGLAARGRDEFRLGLPDGAWTARQNFSDFDGGRSASKMTVRDGGALASMELSAGQFAVARVDGPTSTDAALEVTAVSQVNGSASGTVRNGSSHDLEDVVVLVGASGTNIGGLPAGAEREWSSSSIENFNGDLFMPPEARLWGEAAEPWNRPPGQRDRTINFAMWQSATPAAGHGRPNGIAVAVGWSKDLEVTVELGGRGNDPTGRTAVMATAPVVAPSGLTDLSSRGEVLRPGPVGWGGGNPGDLGRTIRFILPEGATARDLVAVLPQWAPAEVWDGTRWTGIGGPDSGGAPQVPAVVPLARPVPGGVEFQAPPVIGGGFGTAEVTVPASSIRGRRVFVRLSAMGEQFQMGRLAVKPA